MTNLPNDFVEAEEMIDKYQRARRRKIWLTVATCFILAGLGFTALVIGG